MAGIICPFTVQRSTKLPSETSPNIIKDTFAIKYKNFYKLPLLILHYVEYNVHSGPVSRITIFLILKRTIVSKQLKFHFNPFKEGVYQVLGPLEKDIMEALWSHGESSVRDILEAFPANKDISYSAVITVTNRLVNKGLLKRKKVGKTYFYKPSYSKEQFLEFVSQKVVKGASNLSPHSVMAHFVDYMAQMDPDKLEHFSKLIELKRQGKSQK